MTEKIAQALVARDSERSKTPTEAAQEPSDAQKSVPHFLSPAGVAAVEKRILETLARVPETEPAAIEAESQTPVDGAPHFLSPGTIHGVSKGQSEATGEPGRPAVKSRMKRQIWNPFRRRQPASKPPGGPFGFVNQNVPYEAQSSIDNFNFAQSIPQNSFQGNGFQGLQAFVPPPHSPLSNFDKVPAIDFQKPLPPQEFVPPPQFIPEPEIVPPVPTRPVKRPEQVQSPKRKIPHHSPAPPPPPPHVIDGILSQFQRTGQFPPDLSPETALLIADILSGKKQNGPVETIAPAIDLPPPYVEPPKSISHRDPAPMPDFHTKPLASPPVSFGSLPPPPPKSSFSGISRSKVSRPDQPASPFASDS